jgi:hypothetical protein
VRQVNKWLKQWTDNDSHYWLNRIGLLIGQCAKPIRGSKGLSTCDPVVWIKDLTQEIRKVATKKIPKSADENIAIAKIVSLLLLLWSYRVGRAKCHDPRRPVKQRRQGLEKTVVFGSLVTECLLDETHDPQYFPAQDWDVPHAKNARYDPDEMELKRQAYAKGEK